jgi:hypothetical protein
MNSAEHSRFHRFLQCRAPQHGHAGHVRAAARLRVGKERCEWVAGLPVGSERQNCSQETAAQRSTVLDERLEETRVLNLELQKQAAQNAAALEATERELKSAQVQHSSQIAELQTQVRFLHAGSSVARGMTSRCNASCRVYSVP